MVFEAFSGPLKSAKRAIIALLVMQALTLVGLAGAIYLVIDARNAVEHCAQR